MKKVIKITATAALGLTLLATAMPAFAEVPTDGVVVEGTGVPGVSIGDSRAMVESTYGTPTYCQSVSAGDYAYCTYDLGEGSFVFIRYMGLDGGNARASGDDMVSTVEWTGLSGWVTTAGINTSVALSDPEAVIAAYPDATLTYSGDTLVRLRDAELGISVVWYITYPYPTYEPTTVVIMSIF